MDPSGDDLPALIDVEIDEVIGDGDGVRQVLVGSGDEGPLTSAVSFEEVGEEGVDEGFAVCGSACGIVRYPLPQVRDVGEDHCPLLAGCPEGYDVIPWRSIVGDGLEDLAESGIEGPHGIDASSDVVALVVLSSIAVWA